MPRRYITWNLLPILILVLSLLPAVTEQLLQPGIPAPPYLGYILTFLMVLSGGWMAGWNWGSRGMLWAALLAAGDYILVQHDGLSDPTLVGLAVWVILPIYVLLAAVPALIAAVAHHAVRWYAKRRSIRTSAPEPPKPVDIDTRPKVQA